MFYEQISMNSLTENLVKLVYGTVHTDYFPKYDILRVNIKKDNHVYNQTISGFAEQLHQGISSKTMAYFIFNEYKQTLIKETLEHFIK